jgi:glycosyltransferase involved in cell wall biosynthesis
MKSPSKLVIIVLPTIFGGSGDAVNERQLIKYLCRHKSYRCIVFSFYFSGIRGLLRLKRAITDVYKDYQNLNIRFMPIPIAIPLPLGLMLFVELFTSLLIAMIVWILDRIKHVFFIYVRTSILALGFVLINTLAKKTCVKIPAIGEEEVLKSKIPSLIYNVADAHVLDKARAIGVPSPLLLKRLVIKRKVLPKGRIILIPAGIDREKIETLKAFTLNTEGTSVKSYYVKNHYIVGFLGYLEWWQGVDILVKAVAKIKDLLDKPVKLLIVGDGPERRKIEALCKELNVQCSITGFIKHEDALKLLKTFDALVVPSVKTSTTESNIPIKILEAWALGVPVIATRHEIFTYLGLKDKEDIIFCEPYPEDVANKILIVLKNTELRKRLSKKGLSLVKSYYYDIIARSILKVFKRNDAR